jgi:uncharacterized protein YjbI with pentapeptide repeats
MHKCSVCERDFEDEYFIEHEDKCILHCEKTDWYNEINGVKDWTSSEDKIKLFWKTIRKIIKDAHWETDFNIFGFLDLTAIIFPKFEELNCERYEVDEGIYEIENWEFNFFDNQISGTQEPSRILQTPITLSHSVFLDEVDLRDYKFNKLIYMSNCIFQDSFRAVNTVFSKVSFDKSTFFKGVVFENSTIAFDVSDNNSVSEVVFHKEVKFVNVSFSKVRQDEYGVRFNKVKASQIRLRSCKFFQDGGMLFDKNTEIEQIHIDNTTFNKLYIGSKTKSIHLYGNKKTINQLIIKNQNLENLFITNYTVNEDFHLNDKSRNSDEVIKLNNLDVAQSVFNGKVKIQFYDILEQANFYNTKFNDLADFYQTRFKGVVFERTDFFKIAVFSESRFQDVNFKYTKFVGKAIFRDAIIQGVLNLRDTIFDDEANFLDISSEERKKDTDTKEFIGEPKSIQVANRETARIIKNFYDGTNNIIEANRFYALEMKEREKELNKSFWQGKHLSDWLIFKIHSISSDHSQSWVLSLMWIFIIAIIYSFFSLEKIDFDQNIVYGTFSFVIVSIIIIYCAISQYIKYLITLVILITLMLNFLLVCNDALDLLANTINPFSIMTSWDEITIGLLVVKVAIAYLIYQFIISIRQNTKRK